MRDMPPLGIRIGFILADGPILIFGILHPENDLGALYPGNFI